LRGQSESLLDGLENELLIDAFLPVNRVHDSENFAAVHNIFRFWRPPDRGPCRDKKKWVEPTFMRHCPDCGVSAPSTLTPSYKTTPARVKAGSQAGPAQPSNNAHPSAELPDRQRLTRIMSYNFPEAPSPLRRDSRFAIRDAVLMLDAPDHFDII